MTQDAFKAERALDFILGAFGGGATEQGVFFCSLPNSNDRDGQPGEKFVVTRDPETVDRFGAKWDRLRRALYFCVSTIRADAEPGEGGSVRSKDNAAELPFLHSDVDLKDVDVTIEEVILIAGKLPVPPSIIVLSGRGVHLYWLLKEAIDVTDPDERERAETALRQLADLVGGDLSVAHVAALMRLPGSHNTKDDGWRDVEIARADYSRRVNLEDVEDMLSYVSPVITRKDRPAPREAAIETNPFLAAASVLGFKPAIDVESRLAAMRYQGVGEAAIHQTQLQVSASLLARGTDVETVVAAILDATRAAAGEYGTRWNWGREERVIRRMCDAWIRKNPPQARARETVNGRHERQDEPEVVDLEQRRAEKKREKEQARMKAEKKDAPDRGFMPMAIADGVIETVRREGYDLLLTEGEVFIYHEGVWRIATPADEQWLQSLIQTGCETLGEPSKIATLNAAWRRIVEHPKLYRRSVAWNTDLIVCQNGTLDFTSGAFVSHSPENYARRKIGAEYVPDATCPLWEAFVSGLFADREADTQTDLVGVFQEWAGSALATRFLTREQRKALLLVGPSRTGKTEFSRVMRWLIGEPVASPSVAELSERFGLATLYQANAWIRDDAINEGDTLDPQRFKTIVTGEPIDVEQKGRDSIRGVELAIPVLLTTNQLPRARDRSEAIFNRSLVVEMTNVVVETAALAARSVIGVPRGMTLGQHICQVEGPGILNWALAGLRRLVERGSFPRVAAIEAATQRFQDDNNPVGEFARMALRRSGGKVARHDLLCAYHGWQKEQDGDDARAMGARGFFPRLRGVMPWAGDTCDDKGRRYVTGVSLTDEGLQLWEQHSSGPQLKGGSAGTSESKQQVNRIWAREVEEDPKAARF